MMSLNYMGVLHAVHALYPGMVGRREGLICMVSSTLGTLGESLMYYTCSVIIVLYTCPNASKEPSVHAHMGKHIHEYKFIYSANSDSWKASQVYGLAWRVIAVLDWIGLFPCQPAGGPLG